MLEVFQGPVMLWVIVFVVALILEAMTNGLISIWFAGGALLGMLAAAFGAPLPVQIVLFAITSVVLLIFTRPIAMKYFNKEVIKTNSESVVGKQGIVTAEINNILGAGQVTVGGQEWSARSEKDDQVIFVGSVVEIQAINGVKLVCRPLEGVSEEKQADKVQQ